MNRRAKLDAVRDDARLERHAAADEAVVPDNAVAHLRKVMGATDPKKADRGTIRADFGESIEQNAIHGSDSDDNARIEINFFFAESELTV